MNPKNTSCCLLKNANVVTASQVLTADVLIQNGSAFFDKTPEPGTPVIPADGKFLLPGFIDIHNHGGYLFDFTAGQFNPDNQSWDNSPDAFQAGFDRLSRQLAADGLTSFYLATAAANIAALSNSYTALTAFLQTQQHQPPRGATLRGGFLEGCFLNKTMAGAQNPKYALEPDFNTFQLIQGNQSIKLINIAPDFGLAALDLITTLTQRGIVVGAGHTNAQADQVHKAAKAGLRYAIHFTNGPTGGSYKPFHGGGVIEAVLQNPDLYAELILDGFHVNPAYIRDIIKRKTPRGILAITDAMFATGSTIKQFTLAGIEGHLNEEATCIFVTNKPNTLFGSCLRMNKGFENLLNWLTVEAPGVWYDTHNAQPLNDALLDLAQMFSANPARLLGLDKQRIGTIDHGCLADLVLLDISGSPGRFCVNVLKTFVNGACVFDNNP